MDIAQDFGFAQITGDEQQRLTFFDTFAHEFSHLLFYMHFGINVPTAYTSRFSWFNESLAELAGAFWAYEGVEVISAGRISRASENAYLDAGAFPYGDFINFNGTMKSYGMSRLHSTLMHRKNPNYASLVFDYFAQITPSHVTPATQAVMQQRGMTDIVGNAFNHAGLTGSETGTSAFNLLYFMFMENFAADGGNILANDNIHTSYKFITDSPFSAHNLWGVRPNLGRAIVNPGWNNAVFEDGITNLGNNLGARTPFPILNSGGTVSLVGYHGSTTLGATHEMFYQLIGGTSANTMLTISINDDNPMTQWYVVVPNDPVGAVSNSSNRQLGRDGATVHLLQRNNVENIINTHGQVAYLFVATLFRTVNNVPITYSWSVPPTLDLTPDEITINDGNYDVPITINVGGTAMDDITIDRGTLPAYITVTETGGVITVSATRPGEAINDTFTITITRQGVSADLDIIVNLTPTLELNLNTITIDDNNLTDYVQVEGTATGAITLDYSDLPTGVIATVDETTGIITVTGTRPATGQPDIVGDFTIEVTRQGIPEDLTVTVNLTALPAPTLILDPYEITIDNYNLTVDVEVEGTATGIIDLSDDLPIGVTVAEEDGTITVTGVRPAVGEPNIAGDFTVTVFRDGVIETLAVAVYLTALTEAPTLILVPDEITINNSNLIVYVVVEGTAAGTIILDYSNLPTNVTATVTDSTITVTGTRPDVGQPAIYDDFTITVTRQGATETLTINVDLTALEANPTLTLTPSEITVNNNNLEVTSAVGGTAGGLITITDNLPSNVTATVTGEYITVTGTRPAIGDSDIDDEFTVEVTRQGITETLTVNVNLTALTATPTLTLAPSSITIDDNNLVEDVEIEGTATGEITLTDNLPTGVTVVESDGIITVTGTRPAMGQPAITGNFTVTVTRDGLTETLAVSVNLTAIFVPSVGIQLTPHEDHTFLPAEVGYTQAPTHAVQITNTGNVETGPVGIVFSGANPASFVATPYYIPNILPNESVTFNVSPITGLEVGQHLATVTVVSTPAALSLGVVMPLEAETPTFTPQSFDVSFTVVGEGQLVTLSFNPNGGILRGITETTTLPVMIQGTSLRDLGFDSFDQANLLPARRGFRFTGWFASDGSAFTVDTIVNADTTLTARWTAVEEWQPTPTPLPTPSVETTHPVTQPTEITIPINDGATAVRVRLSENLAILDLTTSVVRHIINLSYEGYTTIDLSELTNITSVRFPRRAIQQFADAELVIEFIFYAGSVMFDADATYSIGQQGRTPNITVSLELVNVYDLSDVQQSVVSEVYNATVFAVTIASGEHQIITELDGTVSISVSYSGQLPVTVWLLTEDGELVQLVSSFDEESGLVTFNTSQLGVFLIGYGSFDVVIPPTPPILPEQTIARFVIGIELYTIDGVPHFNDAAPFLDAMYNRTMMPLRAVANALNVEVEWLPETRTVLVFAPNQTLTLTVDVPLPDGIGMPVIVNDRVFVPIRYVAEMLGATVRWDADNMAVYIEK
jgi:uncharacterized repeat protein (TIGR02543 family)